MNTPWYGRAEIRWLVGIIVGVLVFALLKFVLGLIKKRIQKLPAAQSTPVTDLVARLTRSTSSLFVFWLALFTGARFVEFRSDWRAFIVTSMLVVALIQVGLWGMQVVEYGLHRRLNLQTDLSGSQKTTFSALSLVGKIALWVLIGVLILDNLPGIDATSIIASLGIGGIAIGLAVQNILGDLFSSLTITLDKPFIIGDFIKVGEHSGTVEHIGLKSTRIRSLSGEQLIFANSDLLASRVQNYRRMERRRVSYQLGLEYGTDPEQIKAIPGILQEIIQNQPHIQFDRAHFVGFGAYALNFEVVYFIDNSDYLEYMDVQQAIHLETLQRFNAAGIKFAFPVQTVYLEQAGQTEDQK